jgi:hypothetical protein
MEPPLWRNYNALQHFPPAAVLHRERLRRFLRRCSRGRLFRLRKYVCRNQGKGSEAIEKTLLVRIVTSIVGRQILPDRCILGKEKTSQALLLMECRLTAGKCYVSFKKLWIRRRTVAYIASVTRPVCVFCWLG